MQAAAQSTAKEADNMHSVNIWFKKKYTL